MARRFLGNQLYTHQSGNDQITPSQKLKKLEGDGNGACLRLRHHR
jgi:hypothetical protein